jgi:hypothetical protein
MLERRLVERLGDWNAALLAGVLTWWLSPCVTRFSRASTKSRNNKLYRQVVDAVTDAEITFPPTVLWGFRVSSLGLQIVMWSTIALAFGVSAQRQMEPKVQ